MKILNDFCKKCGIVALPYLQPPETMIEIGPRVLEKMMKMR